MKRLLLMCFLATTLGSCATYGVARQQLVPGIRAVISAAGPDLGMALLQDLSSLVGWPLTKGEKALGYENSSELEDVEIDTEEDSGE